MKTQDIPFNMKVHYDDDLNEVAENFEEMEKGVEVLKKEFEKLNDDSIQAAILLGQIGSFLRVLKQLPEAEQTFAHALDILNKHRQIHVRMAIVLRMSLIDLAKKKFLPANKVFEEYLKEIKSSEDKKVRSLLDFVLFHFARSKYAERSYSEAKEMMTKALELRLVRGDLEMIGHTQNALAVINRKLES